MRKLTSTSFRKIKKFSKYKSITPLSQQKVFSSNQQQTEEEILREKCVKLLKMDDFQESALFKEIVGGLKTKEDFITLVKQTSIASSQVQYEGHSVDALVKKPPVRVAVTGAAGNIGYSLLFRIASGEMLGKDQPVILHLLEIPEALSAVKGVAMELEDCAFGLLRGIEVTSDFNKGFKDVDYAILVGAKPRGKGMERKDLLMENAKIFQEQGKALNNNAKKSVLTLVVGNPANTNALIASSNAKKIPDNQFSAMTRLDQDRAMAQLALKKDVDLEAIDNVAIWGNHSATQYPDVSNATIDGKSVTGLTQKYLSDEFIPTVQKRGAAIIDARGSSSAASAADAAIKHMRDWALGSNGKWVSMAVPSDGSYAVKKGVYCSFPVICTGGGKYEIVKNLKLNNFSKQRIKLSVDELEEEKAAVSALLK